MEIDGIEGEGEGSTPSPENQSLDFAQKFENLSRRENQIRQQEKQLKQMGSEFELFNKIKSGSWRENPDDRNALLQTLGVKDYNELGQDFGQSSSREEQASQQSIDPTLKRLQERLDAQDERDRLEAIKAQKSQLRQTIDNFEGEDFAGLKGLDELGVYDLIHNFMDHHKRETGQDIDQMEAARAIQNQYQSTFKSMLQNPYYSKLASEHLGNREEANRDQGEKPQNTISNNMSARPPVQNPGQWLEDDDQSKARMADRLAWN